MKTMSRLSALSACAVWFAASTIVPATARACTCPPRTDTACIETARTGVGSWYRWGGSHWHVTNRESGGADCSGYVIKAWQVPRSSPITEEYHPYGTWHIFATTYHWYSISRSAAWKGDAVGYPDPDGRGALTGHVVLYHYGDPSGLAMVYEAPGSGKRIRHAWRDISGSKWRFRRRHNLTRTSGPN